MEAMWTGRMKRWGKRQGWRLMLGSARALVTGRGGEDDHLEASDEQYELKVAREGVQSR